MNKILNNLKNVIILMSKIFVNYDLLYVSIFHYTNKKVFIQP